MKNEQDAFSTNEAELLEYYGLRGRIGKLRLRFKFLRTWILHSLAYSSPDSNFTIKMQQARGVKIGKSCHISPYVEDNVTIGSNTLIFAHVNPTANLFLKKLYPRKIDPVNIKSGAVLFPGCIITAGITIGKNSLIGTGSIVSEDVPDYCVVIGNPARVVKKIDH
jgi:acetyltransferase-like isoleucine patch superfamily enzyme